MKYEFVKVNNTILDFRRYIKEVEWIKYNIKRKILDLIAKDFIVVKEAEERYDHLNLVLYNKRVDIEIHIECHKKSKESFV